MNKETNNIYKKARIKAGLKREPVAEELHIDVRTLDKYEAVDGKAPDDIVRQMCILYNNKFLAYQHMKNSPLGEFLPDFSENDFKGATLEMINDLNSVDNVILEIVRIASDGRVNDFEKEIWNKNQKQLEKLLGSLTTMLLSDKQ